MASCGCGVVWVVACFGVRATTVRISLNRRYRRVQGAADVLDSSHHSRFPLGGAQLVDGDFGDVDLGLESAIASVQVQHIALIIAICDKVFILILRKSTHLIFMRDCIQIHGWF